MFRIAAGALVVAVLLALVPGAAYAQEGHTLVDATVRVLPGLRLSTCLWLEAGTVTVEARMTGDNQWPIDFALVPDRGPESGAAGANHQNVVAVDVRDAHQRILRSLMTPIEHNRT